MVIIYKIIFKINSHIHENCQILLKEISLKALCFYYYKLSVMFIIIDFIKFIILNLDVIIDLSFKTSNYYLITYSNCNFDNYKRGEALILQEFPY